MTTTHKENQETDLLVGTWNNLDEQGSQVEFTITKARDSYAVRAHDSFDGEEADIFEVNWDGEILSFAAHWNSTGRFARYRIQLISDSLKIIYTYTDHERYERKKLK